MHGETDRMCATNDWIRNEKKRQKMRIGKQIYVYEVETQQNKCYDYFSTVLTLKVQRKLMWAVLFLRI